MSVVSAVTAVASPLDDTRRRHTPAPFRLMLCADCYAGKDVKTLRCFERVDPCGDYQCPECDFYQTTFTNGLVELLLCATWHSQAAYDEIARIPRSAGREIPDTPEFKEYDA